MVMREAEASSVGPTFSVSILKPRPLNMPATRVSTPNLFSTRIEMVCRMKEPAILPEARCGVKPEQGALRAGIETKTGGATRRAFDWKPKENRPELEARRPRPLS